MSKTIIKKVETNKLNETILVLKLLKNVDSLENNIIVKNKHDITICILNMKPSAQIRDNLKTSKFSNLFRLKIFIISDVERRRKK